MKKEYIPTPAEQKLLLIIGDVEYYNANVKEICDAADVSRNTYYEAMKKKGFKSLRKKILDDIFLDMATDVKQAAVKFALNNAKNYQDRKLVLEMSGEYQPKNKVEVTNKIENLSDDELEKKYKEMVKKMSGKDD